MKKLILNFLLSTVFVACNSQNKETSKTEIIRLKNIDSSINKGIEIYSYSKNLYLKEKLPQAKFDTKIGISDSVLMILNYQMSHNAGFQSSGATLKLIKKGITIIDSIGDVKPMENLYFDLLKKEKLKTLKSLVFLNYKNDSVIDVTNNCGKVTEHYPTYEKDKVISRKTNNNTTMQFYYSGSENRLKICRKQKKYDIKINKIDSLMRKRPTILLKDITWDEKEELFYVEKMRPDYWSCDSFFVEIYEVIYPDN